jgi:hypothetical protein
VVSWAAADTATRRVNKRKRKIIGWPVYFRIGRSLPRTDILHAFAHRRTPLERPAGGNVFGLPYLEEAISAVAEGTLRS